MRPALEKGLSLSWCVVYPGTFLLLARQLYEQTYLTWHEGPQMIAFSLAHLHPALFVLGTASYFGSILWLAVAVALAAASRFRLSWKLGVQLSFMLLTLGIDWVPTESWQRGMVFLFGQPA